MTGTVEWGPLVFLGGMLIGAVSYAIVIYNWIEQIRLELNHKSSNMRMHIDATATQLGKDLAQFQLVVAKEYVTSEALMKVEQRLATSIDRLSAQIDRLITSLTSHHGRDTQHG